MKAGTVSWTRRLRDCGRLLFFHLSFPGLLFPVRLAAQVIAIRAGSFAYLFLEHGIHIRPHANRSRSDGRWPSSSMLVLQSNSTA